MRLVYFGSGAFGLPTLEALAKSHELVGVVTQPDRPAGRGARLTPTPVGAWCAEHVPSVPLIKPPKVNAAEVVSQIRSWNADAWVVIAFGQKLGKALLDAMFAVNLHASLLPRWRGAAPINAAILAGDTVTGNSVITLADRMDAGLILAQSRREIDPQQTFGELHDLLAQDGPSVVLRVLDDFAHQRLTPVQQVEADVTIATKLSKDDGVADFRQPADFLRRQIHALTPWPGVSVSSLDRSIEFKVLRASVEHPIATAEDSRPGTIVDPRSGLVLCGGGTLLRFLQIQPPGKRPMSWADFVRGRTILPQTLLTSSREASA